MTQLDSLRDLQSLDAFEVTLEGTSQQAFFSKKTCVYFEWSFGEGQSADGNWVTSWRGYRSDAQLSVKTPKGMLDLSANDLRPYLGPSYEQTFTADNAANAPQVIRDRIKEGHPTLNAKEFCLEPGRSYYARVVVESFMLPPRPGSQQPGRGEHAVLSISDMPYKDGHPQRPISPAFKNHRY